LRPKFGFKPNLVSAIWFQTNVKWVFVRMKPSLIISKGFLSGDLAWSRAIPEKKAT